MAWSTPVHSPVAISHFFIQWRSDNDVQPHEVNVTSVPTALGTDQTNTFHFPNSTGNEQLFITVRSVGRDGHTSIPVYYNMHDEQQQQQQPTTHAGRDASAAPPTTLQSDAVASSRRRIEAIAIAVSMSALLIAASVVFILWHRRYAKRQRNGFAHNNGHRRERGRSFAAATSNSRWMDRGSSNGIRSSSPVPKDDDKRRTSPTAITTLAAVNTHNDAHEMQSLISGRQHIGGVLYDQRGRCNNEPDNNGSSEHSATNPSMGSKLTKNGNGGTVPMKPLFTSTPEKYAAKNIVVGPSHARHILRVESTGKNATKPMSPNNNKEAAICDTSRQPLCNETDTGANDTQSTYDTSMPAMPTDDDDVPTSMVRQQQNLQANSLQLFDRGYQRPLVGPNG